MQALFLFTVVTSDAVHSCSKRFVSYSKDYLTHITAQCNLLYFFSFGFEIYTDIYKNSPAFGGLCAPDPLLGFVLDPTGGLPYPDLDFPELYVLDPPVASGDTRQGVGAWAKPQPAKCCWSRNQGVKCAKFFKCWSFLQSRSANNVCKLLCSFWGTPESTRGPYIVSEFHEFWYTNGLKLDRSFYPASVFSSVPVDRPRSKQH